MNRIEKEEPRGKGDDKTAHRGQGSGRISVGAVAQVGALASAIVASACCWLPLLLIAFGVSGGALSATFEAWRPVFLPVTFALLAFAFNFTYRKPNAASTGGSAMAGKSCCAVPAGDVEVESCCPPENATGFTIKKFNKIILWGVTVFVVAFAFFPNYVGAVLGGSGNALAAREDLDKVAVSIEGMTCEACAVTIGKALRAVPGVADTEVSFEKGEALIGVPKGSKIPQPEILAAISGTGYSGHFVDQMHWELAVEGMTCQGCESLIASSLLETPGVQGVSVNHETGRATVTSNDALTEEALYKAVKTAGFILTTVIQK